MSDIKLGQVPPATAMRDAIHAAVISVVAAEILAPGAHVRLDASGEAVRSVRNPVGIVDPFLLTSVSTGERFWLLLMPGTITGMRHEWEHPAFPHPVAPALKVDSSEAWLREFADNVLEVSYGEMMDAAAYDPSEPCLGTSSYNHPTDSQMALFRHHYRIVTGRLSTAESFRCAC